MAIKICSICKLEKDEDEFYTNQSGKNGLHTYCKFCSNKKTNIFNKNLKLEIIKNYGNECMCCGEKIIEFLSIDHINGNGKKHREEIINNNGGHGLYTWLKRNNYPKDNYQLLCMNCNFAKGKFGFCPHQKLQLMYNNIRKEA